MGYLAAIRCRVGAMHGSASDMPSIKTERTLGKTTERTRKANPRHKVLTLTNSYMHEALQPFIFTILQPYSPTALQLYTALQPYSHTALQPYGHTAPSRPVQSVPSVPSRPVPSRPVRPGSVPPNQSVKRPSPSRPRPCPSPSVASDRL